MLDVKVSLSRSTFVLKAEMQDSGFICLSGLNGSGKSTLLNIISGILKADEGYVRINSSDVTKLPMEKREVVLVRPDSLIPHLQVGNHLVWGAKTKKIETRPEIVEKVKETLGISYGGRVDRLSLGMRERVSLATAFLSQPKVILVDEAFSNIDHRDEFISSYAKLCKSDSIDLVSTTQRKDEAWIADHHYELVAGVSTRVR